MEDIKIDKLITVIVPMYNVEKYIKECIESIEKQTYKNIEVILVDDGSKDETYKIANELKKKYNNILLIRQENSGQASARNVGLKMAKGDYISFIDSDDFIHLDMYRTLIKIAITSDLDIVECCLQDIFVNTGKLGSRYYINVDENKIYDGVEFYNLKPSLSPCNKLYRKTFLNKIKFKCTEGHFAEDAYDTTYAILMAKRIVHINKVFYYYRRDNMESTRNNQSISRRIKLGQDKLFIANKLDTFRREKNLMDI